MSAVPAPAILSTRLGIVQIHVTDLDRAKLFYGRTLGLAPARSDVPGVVCFDAGASLILLYPTQQVAQAHVGEGPQGIIPILYVEDIDAVWRRWSAQGVLFIPAPWATDPSGIAGCPFGRFIGFRDPFGNYLEILQPEASA
jgi:predicted enzyme related to lactoylglutathione lyase